MSQTEQSRQRTGYRMTIDPVSDADFGAELGKVGVTTPDDLPLVPLPNSGTSIAVAPAGVRETITRIPPTLASLNTLAADFTDHCEAVSVELEPAVALDLLASYLGAQFLLLAGPSGTGKSTAGAVLQTFFTPADSRGQIDGRRQLIGPEDIAGYFSPLNQTFISGPDLAVLDLIARPPATAASPSLLVEEINLSPTEGYLSPFVHGLSALATESVRWRLFADDVAPDAGRPAELHVRPYPRLLGTINVDATSMAPARKVAARACVVLLEPGETTDLAQAWALASAPTTTELPDATGAPYVWDPSAALRSPDADGPGIQRECFRLAAVIEHGTDVFEAGWAPATTPVRSVSRRQFGQMVCYASWFDLVNRSTSGTTTPSPTSCRIAAENALLHFVLPTLGAADFESALENLSSCEGRLSVASPGGLLRSRLSRLSDGVGDAALIGRVLDFWDRLS